MEIRQRKDRKKDEEDTDGADTDGPSTYANVGEDDVKKAEKKPRKILTRAIFGFVMIGVFLVVLNAGHIFLCMIIMLLQALVFRELVTVRYIAAQEKSIPLFRSTQWLWFSVAIFYTYGDFLRDFCLSHQCPPRLEYLTSWVPLASMLLYSAVFCVSILSLKRGLYRYQVSVLTWTVVILCICILQAKYVGHNIFNGLFWFFFPCSLVICNDTMAYFCGMFFGRKFIKAPFLKLSPNKTWEGFIGAGLLTCIFGFFFSGYLACFPWLICPVSDIHLVPEPLDCSPHYVFKMQQLQMPIAVRELFPYASFFKITAMPIQGHAISIALFVSVVAPFGGFLASAIKRAYKIKDFDSIIPGHGGFMDRLDCQFITALFTWVYFNTFIRPKLMAIENILATISSLELEEQIDLYRNLGKHISSLGVKV